MSSQKKAKGPGGRPTKYKPEYCQMLIEHMSTVHSFDTFAAIVDVVPDTLYEWCKVHPEFSDAKKIGRMKCKMGIENMLKAQATGKLKGNPASLIFFAKNVTNMSDDPAPEDDAVEGLDFV